jgi:adenylyltransferase/sulfurtransferase
MRFAPLGRAGQERLLASRAVVVGCGALGGSVAQSLARGGVGTLVLVDRDIVEPSNLPRQVLFDDAHARAGVPKVDAARETLERIGGPTQIETHALHLDADNLAEIAGAADIVLDGTDNLATRYLVNDFCVSRDIAWIYAGVVGASGLVLPIFPGLAKKGACLRCLFPDPPPAGTLDSCETAGVILPAVSAVAAHESALAMRWLSAESAARAEIEPWLLQIDLWTGETVRLSSRQQRDCPCCVGRAFTFLDAPESRSAVVLCGRNTVQIRGTNALDLERVTAALAGHAKSLKRAGSLLRFEVEAMRVTLFPDGRALIEGTDDAGRARAVYDRYVGS